MEDYQIFTDAEENACKIGNGRPQDLYIRPAVPERNGAEA